VVVPQPTKAQRAEGHAAPAAGEKLPNCGQKAQLALGEDHSAFCDSNPTWEFGGYEPEVGKPLWSWASQTTTGFRNIIDARLALTLRHHGVTHFATANEKHFEGFGFEKVWNPLIISYQMPLVSCVVHCPRAPARRLHR